MKVTLVSSLSVHNVTAYTCCVTLLQILFYLVYSNVFHTIWYQNKEDVIGSFVILCDTKLTYGSSSMYVGSS